MIVDGHVRVVTGILEQSEGALFLKNGQEVLKLAAIEGVHLPEGNWEMQVTARVGATKEGYVVSRLTPLEVAGTFLGHISQVVGPLENKKFGGNYAILWMVVDEAVDAFNNRTRSLSGMAFPFYLNLDGKGDANTLTPSLEITPDGVVVLRRKLRDVIRTLFPEAFTEACEFRPTSQDHFKEAVNLLAYLVTSFPKTFKFNVQGGKVKGASPAKEDSAS